MNPEDLETLVVTVLDENPDEADATLADLDNPTACEAELALLNAIIDAAEVELDPATAHGALLAELRARAEA